MFALIGVSTAMIVCVTCMLLLERYFIRRTHGPEVLVIDGLEGSQPCSSDEVVGSVTVDKLRITKEASIEA